MTAPIDESDNITLHVHSMVNSNLEKEKIALPVANDINATQGRIEQLNVAPATGSKFR